MPSSSGRGNARSNARVAALYLAVQCGRCGCLSRYRFGAPVFSAQAQCRRAFPVGVEAMLVADGWTTTRATAVCPSCAQQKSRSDPALEWGR